jgi:hypothetical protein
MENVARVGHVVAFEGERLAREVSERIANAADSAGRNLDEALDSVWVSAKNRVLEYTREEPLNALLIALGTGILLGWAFKKNDR